MLFYLTSRFLNAKLMAWLASCFAEREDTTSYLSLGGMNDIMLLSANYSYLAAYPEGFLEAYFGEFSTMK